jgi:hypothetical protein
MNNETAQGLPPGSSRRSWNEGLLSTTGSNGPQFPPYRDPAPQSMPGPLGPPPPSAGGVVFGGNRVSPNVEHGDATAAGVGNVQADAAVVRGAVVTLPSDWAVERNEVLRRLADIQSAIGEIRPLVQFIEQTTRRSQRDGVGGNNPPEPIDEPPIGTTDLAEIATAAHILSGLNAEQQQIAPIQLSHLVLKRAEPKVGALSAWLKSKGNLFVDEYVKAAGSQAGKRSVDGLYLMGAVATLSAAIGFVLNRVEHLLQMLHLLP